MRILQTIIHKNWPKWVGFFVLLACHFLSRPVNLNPLLGLDKTGNNYLDLVVSLPDVLLIFAVLIILTITLFSIFKPKPNNSPKNHLYQYLTLLALLPFGYWLFQILTLNQPFSQNLIQIYFFLKTQSIFILWILLGIFVIKRYFPKSYSKSISNSIQNHFQNPFKAVYKAFSKQSLLWLAPLFTASFFDHFLITSSTPVLLATIFFVVQNFLDQSSQNYTSNRSQNLLPILVFAPILGWYTLNFLSAIFQIKTGQNLGLNFLDEPVLSPSLGGLAKQPLPSFVADFLTNLNLINTTNSLQNPTQNPTENLNILRAYGLTQHPNILGFTGLLGSVFSLANFKNFSYSKAVYKLMLRVLFWLGIDLVITSFSRSAGLGLALVLGLNFLFSIKLSKIWKIAIGAISTTAISTIGYLASTGRSDFYRLQDLQNWGKLIQDDSVQNFPFQTILLGLAPGQYAPTLARLIPSQENWNWMPVHNTFLLLISEFGLLNLILIAVGVWLIKQRLWVA